MSEKKVKSRRSKDSVLTTGFAFLVLFPMMFLMLPTVIFLFLSMLPTLISLIVDSGSKTHFRYKWLCIGGLNFAGSLPYLFRLWFGDNTWDGAVGLFVSGGVFIIIYFTALIGWVFYRCIPSFVLSFLEMADQRRVVYFREAQMKLISKWGEEVASGVNVGAAKKPVSAPAQGEAKKQ